MRRLIFISLVFLINTSAIASCNNHVAYGIPSKSNQTLCRAGYSVGYNYHYKVADWVAYYITKESVSAFFERSNRFLEDKDIPFPYRARLIDYKGSGYDRGHLAPSGTVDFSRRAMIESFLLSNMAPQAPSFNRGSWRVLEEKIRQWTKHYGPLYVVSGPIWIGHDREATIGSNVHVPQWFYKVVLDPAYYDTIAFVVPNQKIDSDALNSFITTVNHVEELTGLDFFSDLPDDIEEASEDQLWISW